MEQIGYYMTESFHAKLTLVTSGRSRPKSQISSYLEETVTYFARISNLLSTLPALIFSRIWETGKFLIFQELDIWTLISLYKLQFIFNPEL